MRPINEDLKGRFESPLQTAANNTDPRLSALLSRDTIPLTSGADLERSVILETSGLTACSVAVRRPRAGREPDAVYAAYIVYLLERCGTDCEGGCEIHVPKQDIRSVCGKYAVEAKDAENDFIITLTKQGESHGAGSCEVADA